MAKRPNELIGALCDSSQDQIVRTLTVREIDSILDWVDRLEAELSATRQTLRTVRRGLFMIGLFVAAQLAIYIAG